jgi:membrane-bound metal-dependent hydrolase YbcI (DUF457 family)
MFLGHFGIALAAKSFAPKASLGTLVLSAQFADCIWPVFLSLGIERVTISPGITSVSPLDFASYPYSHSLVMQLVWGLLLGTIYLLWRRDLRTASLVGLLLPSHWLLDFFAHRADLPLYPGGSRYGLDMWASLPLTIFVEYGLFIGGLIIYVGGARQNPRSNYAFWSLIVFLAAIYPASLFGPPPPSVRVLAWAAIAIWLTIPWASWSDRRDQRV